MSIGGGTTSIGRLGEIVRGILGRLSPLEVASGKHDEEIAQIKARAESALDEIDRLRKITDHQGLMLEEHHRKISELSDNVGTLESEVERREGKIKDLRTAIHGEQVKRGKAAARASRAEGALSRKRK